MYNHSPDTCPTIIKISQICKSLTDTIVNNWNTLYFQVVQQEWKIKDQLLRINFLTDRLVSNKLFEKSSKKKRTVTKNFLSLSNFSRSPTCPIFRSCSMFDLEKYFFLQNVKKNNIQINAWQSYINDISNVNLKKVFSNIFSHDLRTLLKLRIINVLYLHNTSFYHVCYIVWINY